MWAAITAAAGSTEGGHVERWKLWVQPKPIYGVPRIHDHNRQRYVANVINRHRCRTRRAEGHLCEDSPIVRALSDTWWLVQWSPQQQPLAFRGVCPCEVRV